MLLSSTTGVGLLVLNLFARLGRKVRVLVLMHHVNDFLPAAGSRIPPSGRRLRQALSFPNPKGVLYLAPGGLSLKGLREKLPRLGAKFEAIDLPYLWAREPSETNLLRRPGVVTFGFFGRAREETLVELEGLARNIKERGLAARFKVVGFIKEAEALRSRGASQLVEVGSKPLSIEEFDHVADSVDYALWLRSSDEYRFRASASFLDALAYLKPVVALPSPFVEYGFREMGDIGYLARSSEEAAGIVAELAGDFPADRYALQCRNMALGRRRFEPSTVGAGLRSLEARLWSRVGPGKAGRA